MKAGTFYMLGSALAFSVMGILVKLCGQRLPSQEIVLARALVSLVLSYGLIRRAGLSPWGRSRGLLTLRGFFGFSGLSCVFYSVTHLPLAEATVIQYLHPTFTALLGVLFLREHVSRSVWLASALSFLGIALVARPGALLALIGQADGAGDAGLPPLAVGVAIAGAFFSGAAYVVVRKLSRSEDPLVIVFYFPLVSVPATLPTVWSSAIWPQGWEWLWLLGIGFATQAGQIWLTRGLQRLPAARATALSYSQVVFAAVWGIVFFGELPGPWTLAGALLIVVGTGLVAFRR